MGLFSKKYKVIPRQLLRTNLSTAYRFMDLKDIYGFKRINEIGKEYEDETFFKANYESLQTYITKNYGTKTLESLPKTIVLERKYRTDIYDKWKDDDRTPRKSDEYEVHSSLGNHQELITGTTVGRMTDDDANLLFWHWRDVVDYGGEDGPTVYGFGIFGFNSIYKLIEENSKINAKIKIAEAFEGYSKEKINELGKYILEFSRQTALAKNQLKYNKTHYVVNAQEKGDQLLKEFKNRR
jgi:hypothetical protein